MSDEDLKKEFKLRFTDTFWGPRSRDQEYIDQEYIDAMYNENNWIIDIGQYGGDWNPISAALTPGGVSVDIRGLKWLLSKPTFDINEGDIDGVTPLHMAVIYGAEMEAFKLLLDTPGIDINQLDISNWSALYLAIESQSLEIIDLLIAARANLYPGESRPLIFLAIQTKNIDIITRLLNYSPLVGLYDSTSGVGDGDTELISGIRTGSGPIVDLLLSHGADLSPSFDGLTVVQEMEFTPEVLQILQEYDIVPTPETVVPINTPNGATMDEMVEFMREFTHALNTETPELIDAMYVENPTLLDINQYRSMDPVTYALGMSNQSLWGIKWILSKPTFDVNQGDDDGDTPLITAVIIQKPLVISLLLGTPGININKANNSGGTPYSIAIDKRFVVGVGLLREAGASTSPLPYWYTYNGATMMENLRRFGRAGEERRQPSPQGPIDTSTRLRNVQNHALGVTRDRMGRYGVLTENTNYYIGNEGDMPSPTPAYGPTDPVTRYEDVHTSIPRYESPGTYVPPTRVYNETDAFFFSPSRVARRAEARGTVHARDWMTDPVNIARREHEAVDKLYAAQDRHALEDAQDLLAYIRLYIDDPHLDMFAPEQGEPEIHWDSHEERTRYLTEMWYTMKDAIESGRAPVLLRLHSADPVDRLNAMLSNISL